MNRQKILILIPPQQLETYYSEAEMSQETAQDFDSTAADGIDDET